MFVHSISMRVFHFFPEKPPSPRRLGGQVGAQTFIKLPLSDSPKQVKCSSQSQHVSALWLLRISLPRRLRSALLAWPGQNKRPGARVGRGDGRKNNSAGQTERDGLRQCVEGGKGGRERQWADRRVRVTREGGREGGRTWWSTWRWLSHCRLLRKRTPCPVSS